jgi:hypothetical protein
MEKKSVFFYAKAAKAGIMTVEFASGWKLE